MKKFNYKTGEYEDTGNRAITVVVKHDYNEYRFSYDSIMKALEFMDTLAGSISVDDRDGVNKERVDFKVSFIFPTTEEVLENEQYITDSEAN